MTNLVQQEERLKNYNGNDRVVSTIEKAKELKKNPYNLFSISTGFKYLDLLVGKLEATEMIAMTGLEKVGKSGFIRNLTKNFLKQGVQTLWFQYELSYWQFFRSFGGKLPRFYLPNELYNKDMNWIEERTREAVIKYDIKVVVLDPIQYLLDYESRSSPNIEIGAIIRRFKVIANMLNLIVIIISHARKLMLGEKISSQIFRDSHLLPAEADKIWLFDRLRNSQGEGTNKAKLIVSSDRRTGTMGKKIDFLFDKATETYTEVEKLPKLEKETKKEKEEEEDIFSGQDSIF